MPSRVLCARSLPPGGHPRSCRACSRSCPHSKEVITTRGLPHVGAWHLGGTGQVLSEGDLRKTLGHDVRS